MRDRSDARLIGWTLSGSADDGIRLMAPTTVRSGDGGARPAPTDYARAVLSTRGRGARILEHLPTTVGGEHARRFTVTTSRAIDAGLGCWSPSPDDCLALTPGITLDLVVLSHHGRPLLLWSRTWRSPPDPRLARSLDRLIDSVTFVDPVPR